MQTISLDASDIGHYENLPMEYTEIFLAENKNEHLIGKNNIINSFAQNIDVTYMITILVLHSQSVKSAIS